VTDNFLNVHWRGIAGLLRLACFVAFVSFISMTASGQPAPTFGQNPSASPLTTGPGGQVTISLIVYEQYESPYNVPDKGFTGTCSIGDDNWDITFQESGGIGKPHGYVGTGSVVVDAPNDAGTVTVACNVTVSFSTGSPKEISADTSFTVVSCTGSGNIVASGPPDTTSNSAYIYQLYALSLTPPDGLTYSSSSPGSGTSTGLSGDDGIYDCSGCANTTSVEQPSASAGQPQVSGTGVTVQFSLAVWKYYVDDVCENDSSEYATVEAQLQSPLIVAASASCSQ